MWDIEEGEEKTPRKKMEHVGNDIIVRRGGETPCSFGQRDLFKYPGKSEKRNCAFTRDAIKPINAQS